MEDLDRQAVSMRVIREVPYGSDTPRKIGWCLKHSELAWEYEDRSIACMYPLVIESSSASEGCRFIPALLILPDYAVPEGSL